MEDLLGDRNVEQGELCKEWEIHGRHSINGEITMLDLGYEEGGCKAEHYRCQQPGLGVAEIELLEVGESRGAKPTLGIVAVEVAGAAAVEVKPAGGARVLGDYLEDGGG